MYCHVLVMMFCLSCFVFLVLLCCSCVLASYVVVSHVALCVRMCCFIV